MEPLTPEETMVEGKWLFNGKAMTVDSNCERIEWLINESLNRVEGGMLEWERLYQDPRDNRYWLLTYPQSHMHGGGPPALKYVSEATAKSLCPNAS